MLKIKKKQIIESILLIFFVGTLTYCAKDKNETIEPIIVESVSEESTIEINDESTSKNQKKTIKSIEQIEIVEQVLPVESTEIIEESTEITNITEENEKSNTSKSSNKAFSNDATVSSVADINTDENTTNNVEEYFSIPDGTYNYCPSVIKDNGSISMFYCSNTTPYKVIDNICYSNAEITSENNILFKNRYTVLTPTAGAWDSVHVCDPSVIAGNFSYHGSTYRYLMAYLGCDTTDCQKNQIGFAVSNSLSEGWIKIDANPVVRHNYDSSQSGFQWGVGQASLVSIDNAGHILLFYTEGTYSSTSTKVMEIDASNLDNIQVLSQSNVSTNGTNDFISNADFALSGNTLYMICDKHPFGGSVLSIVADASCVYSCEYTSLDQVTWNKVYTVGSSVTGFTKNHNCGLCRDIYGHLAENSVVYTSASEFSDFSSSLYSYRLKYAPW